MRWIPITGILMGMTEMLVQRIQLDGKAEARADSICKAQNLGFAT